MEKNNKIIANKYKIDEIISNGSFGYVFKGISIGSNEPVAIKIENSENQKSLKHETKILNYLYSNKVRKIPSIYWYGEYHESPCLIITYYDYSLASYVKKPKKSTDKNMSHKIVATILDILSNIHKNFILHRDLKPENFMIKNNEIYLIDFGLATFYIDSDCKHIPNEPIETIIGSPRWISIHILEGNKYSRRDDLISLGYIYAYLLLEKTPWEPEIESQMTTDIIKNKLNINNSINNWRRENRSIDMFKKWLEGVPVIIYDYLKTVYDYSYADIPKYNELIDMILLCT